MARFELSSSGVGSDRSANRATNTANLIVIQVLKWTFLTSLSLFLYCLFFLQIGSA